MKKKYLQLVEHSDPFPHYAMHEALIEKNQTVPYWIGSKPLRRYDNYEDAIVDWGKKEREFSAYLDILHYDDIENLIDKVDYGTDDEIIFD